MRYLKKYESITTPVGKASGYANDKAYKEYLSTRKFTKEDVDEVKDVFRDYIDQYDIENKDFFDIENLSENDNGIYFQYRYGEGCYSLDIHFLFVDMNSSNYSVSSARGRVENLIEKGFINFYKRIESMGYEIACHEFSPFSLVTYGYDDSFFISITKDFDESIREYPKNESFTVSDEKQLRLDVKDIFRDVIEDSGEFNKYTYNCNPSTQGSFNPSDFTISRKLKYDIHLNVVYTEINNFNIDIIHSFFDRVNSYLSSTYVLSLKSYEVKGHHIATTCRNIEMVTKTIKLNPGKFMSVIATYEQL